MNRFLHLISLIIAIALITGCSLQTKAVGDNKLTAVDGNKLLQPVSSGQIEKIRAAKMVFEKPGDATIKSIDLTLAENQTNEIIKWYNSIPENRVMKIDDIEGSIKLGVVFELHNNKGLRIQYSSAGDIFVTVSQPEITKYKIEMPEIKPLFDQLLK